MNIDEIVKKYVSLETNGNRLPRLKNFNAGLDPFLCPLCGYRICGNMSYYCHEECINYSMRAEENCNNECCGEVEAMLPELKKLYPELAEYSQKWWIHWRKRAGTGWYQEYPAESYIIKMINILWCLDQELQFTTIHNILKDGLFEI